MRENCHFRKGCPAACLFLGTALMGPGSSLVLAADRQIDINTLRDKIKGGWVGYMAGTAWGGPTEFSHQGTLIPDNEVPVWIPDMINGGFNQDDLYMQMPFVNALNDKGVNCDWTKFGDNFRVFTPQLWHANFSGRQNLQNGYEVPDSGHYSHDQHCDDIDWQIESSFAGLMAPGAPNAADELAWRRGHTMNCGDGVYGGVFMAAMQAEAFFATHVDRIIQTGHQAIPVGSEYRQVIEDVIAWHAQGKTWQEIWQALQDKWGNDDRCPDGINNPFDIDAKLNGGYVLIGLLYGGDDFESFVRIAMQCGQDSDSNPGCVGSVLGTYFGFSGLPDKFRSGLDTNEVFSGTSYTVDEVAVITENMARQILTLTGGSISGNGANEVWSIPDNPVRPMILEQWPTNANPPPTLSAGLVSQTNLTVTFTATATDSDGISGYQCFFGDITFTNGSMVAHTYLQHGNYTVICYVSDDIGNTSYPTLKVYADTNPPVLLGTQTTASNQVRITFSEEVEPVGATNPFHYAISPGITVLGAVFGSDAKTILLTTSPLATGATYTGLVGGVSDLAMPPNTIASNSQATFVRVPFAVWHSYNAVLSAGSPQGTVQDVRGLISANLDFYESTNDGGADLESLFSTFKPGPHPESFNAVGTYWANGTGQVYPYAGKSLSPRSSSEVNVSAPLGVLDLQLHPQQNDHLVVAAFVTPVGGFYRLTDLGVRRPYFEGGSVTYRVFDKNKSPVASLQAFNDTAWVTSASLHSLGWLAAGDRIYFTVDRDGDYGWDVTEIAWTLSAATDAGAVRLLAQPVTGGHLRLSWLFGTLLEARTPSGPWTTNLAASPYTSTPVDGQKFFRVILN